MASFRVAFQFETLFISQSRITVLKFSVEVGEIFQVSDLECEILNKVRDKEREREKSVRTTTGRRVVCFEV
ncbi:hypothetical protein RJT34_11966 [Clitoria ternatea]|uniref:Uncharacterized protein n=1 Tax=Clitoria ternatea TaxID=43366 RepID=A0AAN9JMU2_CLITE